MTAAQNGEAGSYARLLAATTPFLRTIAERRLGNVRDAERAVQQALLTIHRLRHTYDPRQPIAPWLSAITDAEATRMSAERAGREARPSFAACLNSGPGYGRLVAGGRIELPT